MNVRVAAAACLPLLALVACSSTSEPPPSVVYGAGSGQGGLAAASRVVAAAEAEDVEVLADRLVAVAATHKTLADARPGMVLLGERGAAAGTRNPEGFLRRVVSVTTEGDRVVVKTAPATLFEAFDTLQFQASLTTPPLTVKGPANVGTGLRPQQVGNGQPITVLDASGEQLVDETGQVELAPGKTIGVRTQVKLPTAKVVFTPTWDVGMKLGQLSFDVKKAISEAHVIGKGKLDAEIEVFAGLELVGNATGDDLAALVAKKVFQKQDKKIADYDVSLGSIKLGPLSAPASAHFSATLSCEMNWGGPVNVTVGGKASGEIEAGFRYENETISPVFGRDASLTHTGPAFAIGGAAHVLCTLEPRFELKLFGIAAADVWADPYVSLGAEATCGDEAPRALTGDVTGYAQAGVSASARVKVDVFGLFKKEIACKLFDVQSDLAEATAKLPLGAGATCTSVPIPPRPARQENPLPGCFGDEGATGGEPADPNGGGAEGGACHDTCEAGEPLASTCTSDNQAGACIRAICERDPYCCETFWGPSCIGHVTDGDYGCTPRACQ